MPAASQSCAGARYVLRLPPLTQWQMLWDVTGVATGERANLKLRTLELALAVSVVVPAGIRGRQACALRVSPPFLHDTVPKLSVYCFLSPDLPLF